MLLHDEGHGVFGRVRATRDGTVDGLPLAEDGRLLLLVDRANGLWRTDGGRRPLYDEVDVAMWGCADGEQRITTAMA